MRVRTVYEQNGVWIVDYGPNRVYYGDIMSEILGRLDRTIKSQGPDSLLVQAREALHAAYETIAELRQDVETWRRRCAEETLAWARADTKAQAFDRIALAFQESIDPDDGIVNEPQDLFDLIDSLSRDAGKE